MRQDRAQNVFGTNRITNTVNQVYADKLQFFSSCLDVICFKSGEFYHYEVEHHISLIDHLIFILDCTIKNPEVSNKQYPKFCFNQIKEICKSHPLFGEKDLFLSEDSTRRVKIDTLLQKIENEPDSPNIIERLTNIRFILNEIKALLDSKYFESIIQCLYNKIVCQHTLKFHRNDFEYLARLIFSYYYLLGYSRKKINSFGRKILESEVVKEGHRIYTETYLPKDLYEKQIANNKSLVGTDTNLFSEIKSFVKNRGLKGQIQAYSNVLHYLNYEHHLVFRLDGLIISSNNEEDELEIFNLKISRIDVFKKKYSEFDFENTRDFFSNEFHSAVVEIKVEASSQDDAIYLALDELGKKLGRIMRATNSRFTINRKHYSCISDLEKEIWVNTMPEIASIGRFSLDHINKLDIRISNSPHRELYFELEKILQNGYLEDNPTISIHFYRKFMELLNKKIKVTGVPNTKGTSTEILNLAYLITYFEKTRYQSQTRIWAHNRLINADFLLTDNTNPSFEYRNKVRKLRVLLPFRETLKYIHEFDVHTRFELTRAMNFSNVVDEKKAFEYYVRHLLFVKQYRDKYEHANITDDMVARKLALYTYRLMSQLLECIFAELSKDSNKNKESGEILKEIILKAKGSI